jgi:acylphosphatase
MERLHIRVFGEVQGVFFRAGAQDAARRFGLCGWARNVNDGSVEILAEGERGMLEGLLEWCQHGPPGASVTEAKCVWSEGTGEFTDFRIRYSTSPR